MARSAAVPGGIRTNRSPSRRSHEALDQNRSDLDRPAHRRGGLDCGERIHTSNGDSSDPFTSDGDRISALHVVQDPHSPVPAQDSIPGSMCAMPQPRVVATRQLRSPQHGIQRGHAPRSGMFVVSCRGCPAHQSRLQQVPYLEARRPQGVCQVPHSGRVVPPRTASCRTCVSSRRPRRTQMFRLPCQAGIRGHAQNLHDVSRHQARRSDQLRVVPLP